MTDMRAVIEPRSDQLNSDDLWGGPRTVTITSVSVRPGTEQPVSISFEGDNQKPYKPCKSMARVLVAMWGADAKAYTGRSLTLYRDPDVTWGGMKVGGIRISHMSDIEREHVMALTVTKQSRKPFTVKPLRNAPPPAAPSARPADEADSRPVPPAAGQPQAMRAAGDVPAREWTKTEADKRGAEIAAILRDHGGSIANMSWSWGQHESEIKTMPDGHRRRLRQVYETEMAKVENADNPDLTPPDERQSDMLGN